MSAGGTTSQRPVLHALTGCTATGKTEWALRWAEEHGAEIVSCDSLLFYRGMDIGTAKPTREELARVPHHLIDVCALSEQMNIATYVKRAREALDDIARRGRQALVVGGSGFYLKAFFGRVVDEVAVKDELRASVSQLTPAAMLERLHTLNPGGLGTLDTANPRRVSRALERCLASGRTLTELAEEFARQPAPFAAWDVRLTRIDRDAVELDERIPRRVGAMLREGLVSEVRSLLGRGLKENPSASRAIGYREVIDVIEGRSTEVELPTTITKNTRALVKKQRTWFRTQLPAHRVVNARELVNVTQLFAPG